MPCCDASWRSCFVWSIKLEAEGLADDAGEAELVDDAACSEANLAEDGLAASRLDFVGLTGPGLSSTLCFLGDGVGSGVGESALVVDEDTGVDKKREGDAKQDTVCH